MSDWNISGLADGEDPRAVIAEYVLGLAEPGQRTEIERAMETDPQIAAEMRLWENHLADLNAAFEPETPPQRVLTGIEARLFGAETAPAKSRWFDSLAFWRGATGIAVAAAVIGIGLNVLAPTAPGPEAVPDAELVAAMQPVESDLSVLALYEPEAGQLRLTAHGSSAGEGNDYELWIIVGEDDPVSLGVIGLGEGAIHAVTEDHKGLFDQGVTLAVTREQAGGSPTGAPMGPIVSAGQASVI